MTDPNGEVVHEIDDREGVFKALSLVAENGPARKGALFDPWRTYLAEVSNARSDSYANSTLYDRLKNLRARGYVELSRAAYSITSEGLSWLDHSDESEAAPGGNAYQQILSLARSQKQEISDTLHELLHEMDPYAFEHMVAQLLDNMGYDNPQVTPRGNDKGVDVVASIEMGITTVQEVIQVKRQRNNIQRPVLDALRGSLHRFRADRGTIISTGGFSKGTVDAAIELGAAPITLIDGHKLVELLIEHGIGVKKKPIEIWELDASAFDAESEEEADED
jgi:restriction system protein